MPSGRLQQQFIRLWQCCDGKTQDTTLNELADLLNCSRRHMRTLLNTMQARGWLTWEAEVGRGKRSRLTFLYTGLALQQQRAEDLLEQDRIDQLVQLVGDKSAVRQMLISHLGRSFRQGRHILRVLYYRPKAIIRSSSDQPERKLTAERNAGHLTLRNPTPYYITVAWLG
ncbi:SgrR family transcriptional regulator, partial [Salmonella enterica subsp. enterica serovar Anatum]|nr:SgrR family transcriptional regulator [Salmonella enterica subsp. enterica serovar Anatum]